MTTTDTGRSDSWTVFAVRYGCIPRNPRDNTLLPPARPTASTMSYFVWLLRRGSRTLVVDTGFAPEDAEPRGRTQLQSVPEGLAALDVHPADVSDVVLTHLHNDHSGGTALFPNATFHLQERELAYATGPAMRHPRLSRAYDAGDIGDVLGLVRNRRVHFYDGDATIADNVKLHLLGGHTPGSQAVSVLADDHTGGQVTVVLASDASHYYENLDNQNPFPVLVDMPDVFDAYERMTGLTASGQGWVVPGHDPLVTERHPPPSDDLRGWISVVSERPSPLEPQIPATANPNPRTGGEP